MHFHNLMTSPITSTDLSVVGDQPNLGDSAQAFR
jgi:hypothetical protein